MPRLTPLLLLPALLAACASGQTADYPALVPLDTVLIDQPLTPSPAPGLEARAAALRARADRLRSATP
ncbi:hypothetical protein CKO11_12945 [Rhodobacter sp. TJ_12]|uniref:hypothetical protein n=1 Tax=Rhodobacter sp. TJ_12 TaxID=2029399 RepID=UPI001CBFFFB1|nr:hypothetical protein [Rhodobacter sp. TJ_12]MBZ4023365.1 hypothetical protein [Rhodobacter sp. TJ_12]